MSALSLVSVIIPVFDGERYLAEAIESVLAQTYDTLEIIVVDDGSTDGSSEVAKRFASSIRYFFQVNRGLSAALNYGVEMARGDFFAFLDADDLWAENKLACQMAAFEGDPALDAVFGHVKQFFSPELDENQRRRIRIPAEAVPGIIKGTILIKRKSFFQVGAFDLTWKVGDFIDWYSKSVEKGLRSIVLPDVLLKRRVHDENWGIRKREHRKDYVRILKASLDRRRRSGDREGM